MDERDRQALEAYARGGDRAGMSRLVERHIGLVYSAAVRQVRDEHLAEDVTQAVFMILCDKAGSIPRAAVLEGWLFNTTWYAAANAARMKRRREIHERRAAKREAVMNTSESDEAAWERMAP